MRTKGKEEGRLVRDGLKLVLGAPLVSFTGIRVLLLQASENIPLNKESVQTLSPRGLGRQGEMPLIWRSLPRFHSLCQRLAVRFPGRPPGR